ncbi:MAG TPA: YdeI/OmpD-associated family protein [Vicinamibacterales bacterium]|nr:YdeI/OmpD-associated family protein [Vicinamibacterales bacterium]
MGRQPLVKPTFFASASEFRTWLEAQHESASEIWVGFHKRATGRPSLTWTESVREALCYGWIDGIRKRIDNDAYTIRFTPRKRGSVWSAVNVRHVQSLLREGRMRPRGLEAYEARRDNKCGIYSYEQRSVELPPQYAKVLKKNAAAFKFFESQPPSYRRAVMWWIVSAKTEETRTRRLSVLIHHSAKAERLPALAPTKRTR